MVRKVELVFIPSPGIGHLISMVEIARLLIDRDERLSITVLIMQFPTSDSKISSYIRSTTACASAGADADDDATPIKFIELRRNDGSFSAEQKSPPAFLSEFVDAHKTQVRDAVAKMVRSGGLTCLAGFVVDMFCTTMIDVANEFGLPSYVFFTSSAACLGLMLHLQGLRDDHNLYPSDFKNSGELLIPCFSNPVPASVLPAEVQDKDDCTWFLNHAQRFRETKGIIVNTMLELESRAFQFLNKPSSSSASILPPVYAVGPILSLKRNDERESSRDIIKWLDDQSPSSVVFLCFGSMGALDEYQAKEIAYALEKSGQKFLWSLRKPQPKGTIVCPEDYSDLLEVLPEGFLKRTASIGKVIGWAPQVAVLSHPAVGGFVSHCGWNSTLESLWYAVPVATWPLHAEQQLNAFQMVKELELAVEIKIDYRKNWSLADGQMDLMPAEKIENGIRLLMGDEGSIIREKVKGMKEKIRMSLKSGSSFSCLGQLIGDIINNMP